MAATGARLSNYLDHEAWNHPELLVEPELLRRYAGAIDVVSADDPTAVTACFTSAYGKSPVRAGSYLRCSQSGQVRRFAAEEIARLMGFGDSFHWPAEFSQRSRYSMIGNALSVTVVRGILQSLLTG